VLVDTNNSSNQIKVLVFMNFFFSSRRRHTRSKRDWSSDVCSSDLVKQSIFFIRFIQCHLKKFWLYFFCHFCRKSKNFCVNFILRSEERRVGKECRYGMGL